LHSRPYLAWSTGAAAAYPALDAAAAELAKLRKECDRFAELARMFDLAGAFGVWCMWWWRSRAVDRYCALIIRE